MNLKLSRLPVLMRTLIFCFFTAMLAAFARADSLFGRVLEKVVCEADATQSYALYVPANYSKERRWPVVFCFDPSARGNIPVERLRVAAEKYGYIVAGSLTSRNGPYAANAVAAQAMVKDVSAHFSVDPQRVYSVGMSGGARVATILGLSGVAKGVIACGAGFPASDEGVPREVSFVFYGIVGQEDFNLAEMRRLDGELDERKAVHRIATFAGGHVWAPESSLTEAVEWLELQAMRAGKKPKDAAFIHAQLKSRLEALPELAAVEKWRSIKSLATDFDGLIDTGEFAQQAATFGGSREVKDGLKAEKDFFFREEVLVEQLGDAAMGSVASKQRLAAKLRQRMDTAGNPAERRMVSRAVEGYCSIARETARDLFEQREFPRVTALLEMFVALKPSHARGWYDLARAYAAAGDKDDARKSLERAVDCGFDDIARVEAEPAFAKVRTEAGFAVIVERIRTQQSAPDMELPAMRVSAVLASVELRIFYLSKAGAESAPVSFLRVERVRAGSAAERAGVVAGLEITAIQGLRVRGMSETELDDAVAQPAKGEIALTVRDSSRAKENTLRIPLTKTLTAAPVEPSSTGSD